MKTVRRLSSVLALGLLLNGFTSPCQAMGLHLLAVQANGIGVYPTAGTSSFSGQVSWAPRFDLGVIGLRGELGATLLKGNAPSSFVATNLEGFACLEIFPMVSIEGGGGMSTWHNGNGGTHPILSGYFVISPPGGLDRIFFAYSRFMIPDFGVNELKLGIGFDL